MINLTTRKNNSLQLSGNLLTGDTYPVRNFIKSYAGGEWDKDARGWRVDVDKLMHLLDINNSIGLRIASETVEIKTGRTGSTSTNGWCNLCHSYCWGDCES